MNQSNSSMSRSTAETLKQIQKQGLSISIVGGDSSKTFPVETASKESRDKQNVPSENISTSRAVVSPENKQTVMQARHVLNTPVETRASSAQSVTPATQTVSSGNIKSSPPVSSISETKTQNAQRMSSPIENKIIYTSANRSKPLDKNQLNIGRLSQTPVVEKKVQSRISQAEMKNQVTHTRTQSLISDCKSNSSLNRPPTNSPPLDVKTNNQGRLNQNNSVSIHDKNVSGQRNQVSISELKTTNSQCKIPAKQNDNRTVGALKTRQNVNLTAGSKTISQFYPAGSLSNSASNSNKSFIEKTPQNALSERSINNPFRVAATKVTTEEKPVHKLTRFAQNAASSENQPIQSKITQHILMKSDNRAASPAVKISEISSETHQRSLASDSTSESPPVKLNTMPIQKTGVKRVSSVMSTPALNKRKCVKIVSPIDSDQSGSQSDINTLSSDESPVKEPKVFNLRKLTPGLTITPIQSSSPSTSGSTKKLVDSDQNIIVICPSCKQCSFNLVQCDSCHEKFITTPLRYQIKSRPSPDSASIVVTQNVTTSIEKSMQIVYHLPTGASPNPSFPFQPSPQVIKVAGRRGRPKRRAVEPICYTLSSDDEEAVPFEAIPEDSNNSHLLYMDSEGCKSDQSNTSDMMHDESQEFNELDYPGVTRIHSKQHLNMNNEDEEEEEEEDEEEDLERGMESEEELMEEEEEEHPEFDGEEEMEEEEEDEEEIPPDEEERLAVFNKTQLSASTVVLKCRSIRIGSYKIHPEQHASNIDVTLNEKSIQFIAPALLEDEKRYVVINLRACDTVQMWIHFGKCLPIIFAYTSKQFGESVQSHLNLIKGNTALFDPTSDDMKKNKLTFLIDTLSEEQRTFMRQIFPGPEKLKEIDQKEANEILVKSTPQQNLIKIESSDAHANVTTSIPVTGVIPANLATQHSISITKVMAKPTPPAPVTKILTYPPPPYSGGIAINTADLATLDEGEFLNDAILDFYLKYVFYEKLSDSDRGKTHIFSSFFYPRLTQKPDRLRPGDDGPKTMQVRRHNQVKTWTKHVDIFSKDYIIIPVNQHNHWFLAFICYPGHVPDVPLAQVEPKTSKADNVTSTDDQDTSKVVIKEEAVTNEDMQNPDESSMNSNSFYEVEEPPDSEDSSSEIPDSSTHPDGNVIFHETYQRKETPCILIFDSLSGPNRWRIASTLREYLEIEWKIRKGTKKVFDRNTMQGFIVKCPQQTNFSDCGLYVLQYVESFFENPIPYFGNPMPDLTKWFSDVKISKKRQQLKELILNLQKQYQVKQVGISIKKVNQSTVSSGVAATPQDNR